MVILVIDMAWYPSSSYEAAINPLLDIVSPRRLDHPKAKYMARHSIPRAPNPDTMNPLLGIVSSRALTMAI